MSNRVAYAGLHSKVIAADKATWFVNHGDALGISGSTGADYPKTSPITLANHDKEPHVKGEESAVDIYTGASTVPDCDGIMAEADIACYRMPYQGDLALCKSASPGRAKHQDIHLSHFVLYIEQGFLSIDAAIVEVTRITEDGRLISSSGAGNSAG